MTLLSHENHFKFGYNDEWFNLRQSPDDQWRVSYGSCVRNVGNFHDECLATARLIRDSVEGPLNVLFSGGSESEMIVRAFHELKIPIKVSICQFSHNLNLHDISHAIVCCLQLGISYNLIPLNVDHFFDNGDFMPYAEATQTRTPELCPTMWLADQVDGTPIIGSGECIIIKRDSWYIQKRETFLGLYRHFLVQDRLAVPGFFLHTPEIILSFLKDEQVLNLINSPRYEFASAKFGIYKTHFPLAERKKYHGFERLPLKMSRIRSELWKKWPGAGASYLTDYNDLIEILEGKREGHLVGVLEQQKW